MGFKLLVKNISMNEDKVNDWVIARGLIICVCVCVQVLLFMSSEAKSMFCGSWRSKAHWVIVGLICPYWLCLISALHYGSINILYVLIFKGLRQSHDWWHFDFGLSVRSILMTVISGTPWKHFFKCGTNVHLDSRTIWFVHVPNLRIHTLIMSTFHTNV